jgi:hypothetical protein
MAAYSGFVLAGGPPMSDSYRALTPNVSQAAGSPVCTLSNNSAGCPTISVASQSAEALEIIELGRDNTCIVMHNYLRSFGFLV